MASKLLFRFRSGTHGQNKEVGRLETVIELFCECECKSVENFFWECSEYSRNSLEILMGFYRTTFI